MACAIPPVTRVRHVLARRPWIHRGLLVVLVGTSVWLTTSWAGQVEAERARWGRSSPVLVTTGAVEAGTPLAGAVTVVRFPDAVVPERALPTDAVGNGHVVRRHLPAGGVVTELDIGAATGPRALLEPDELVVAITERVSSGARIGDTAVIVTEGMVLASGATVVGVDDPRVLLAVHHDAAPMVAAAAAGSAGVSLLLEP